MPKKSQTTIVKKKKSDSQHHHNHGDGGNNGNENYINYENQLKSLLSKEINQRIQAKKRANDAVDWYYHNHLRKLISQEAYKKAQNVLSNGMLRHRVDKIIISRLKEYTHKMFLSTYWRTVIAVRNRLLFKVAVERIERIFVIIGHAGGHGGMTVANKVGKGVLNTARAIGKIGAGIGQICARFGIGLFEALSLLGKPFAKMISALATSIGKRHHPQKVAIPNNRKDKQKESKRHPLLIPFLIGLAVTMVIATILAFLANPVGSGTAVGFSLWKLLVDLSPAILIGLGFLAKPLFKSAKKAINKLNHSKLAKDLSKRMSAFAHKFKIWRNERKISKATHHVEKHLKFRRGTIALLSQLGDEFKKFMNASKRSAQKIHKASLKIIHNRFTRKIHQVAIKLHRSRARRHEKHEIRLIKKRHQKRQATLERLQAKQSKLVKNNRRHRLKIHARKTKKTNAKLHKLNVKRNQKVVKEQAMIKKLTRKQKILQVKKHKHDEKKAERNQVKITKYAHKRKKNQIRAQIKERKKEHKNKIVEAFKIRRTNHKIKVAQRKSDAKLRTTQKRAKHSQVVHNHMSKVARSINKRTAEHLHKKEIRKIKRSDARAKKHAVIEHRKIESTRRRDARLAKVKQRENAETITLEHRKDAKITKRKRRRNARRAERIRRRNAKRVEKEKRRNAKKQHRDAKRAEKKRRYDMKHNAGKRAQAIQQQIKISNAESKVQQELNHKNGGNRKQHYYQNKNF